MLIQFKELKPQEEPQKGFHVEKDIIFKNSIFGSLILLQSGNGVEKEQAWKEQD